MYVTRTSLDKLLLVFFYGLTGREVIGRSYSTRQTPHLRRSVVLLTVFGHYGLEVTQIGFSLVSYKHGFTTFGGVFGIVEWRVTGTSYVGGTLSM